MHPLFTGEEMSWLVLGHSEAKELGTQDQWLGLPFSPTASQPHFAHAQSVHFCLGSGWFRTSRAIWHLFTVEAVSSWGSPALSSGQVNN